MAWWAMNRVGAPHDEARGEALERILDALPRYPEYMTELMYRLPNTAEIMARFAAIYAQERKRPDSVLSDFDRDRIDHLAGAEHSAFSRGVTPAGHESEIQAELESYRGCVETQ